MGQLGHLVISTVVVTATAMLLVKVLSGPLDIAGAVVLIAGLVIFARALIRFASEPGQAARSR
jgi:Ca2+/H+ antiporter